MCISGQCSLSVHLNMFTFVKIWNLAFRLIMVKSLNFLIGLLLVFMTLYSSSCYKLKYNEDPNVKLRFSADTLRFDTVFTTLGSATRILKVYNDYDLAIQLSSIVAEGGEQSPFRFNIDGIPGNNVQAVDIPARDSIYIFGEVTVDPDQDISVSPFITEDKLYFKVNGNEQFVQLEAWGQNANYIPNSQAKGKVALLSCDFGQEIWDDPRPYVIYGVLAIDSCELVIPEGTNIYVHGGIVVSDEFIYNDGILLILKDGSITVQGTQEDPVIIQGDRLEEAFQDIAGQWAGIRVLDESKGNTFSHTIIKNSIIGLRVDSLAEAELDACQIYNTTSSGLIGYHAKKIYAKNSLFHSNGTNAGSFVYGGNYSFDYCSFDSYGIQGPALVVRNYRCQDPLCLEDILVNPVSLNMQNCIVSGSGSDEMVFDDGTFGSQEGYFNFNFENSLLKIDTILNSNNYPNFFDHCLNCASIQDNEPLYLDIEDQDYHLDSLSQATGKAKWIGGINVDLEGTPRDPSAPDIGCYESGF